VLFGGDWPHIGGLPRPLDALEDLAVLSEADRRLVTHDNAMSLVALG